MFDAEGYVRAHTVLDRALHSTSRVTRVRAVSMLARYPVPERQRWLEDACNDPDEAVRQVALAVLAWTEESGGGWPDREDPKFDRLPLPGERVVRTAQDPMVEASGWHYVLEVWRGDGMLVGVFFAATRDEDDAHARRMALGQAILASAGPHADRFDPETAAVFIVEKHRAGVAARSSGLSDGWDAYPGR